MSDPIETTPVPSPSAESSAPRPAKAPGEGLLSIEAAPTYIPTAASSGSAARRPGGLAPQSLLGQLLGHFRIDDYIGTGGMGTVFRATDLRLQRPVALKLLPPEFADDPAAVQRFHNEARAAAHLDHEGIARVYYVGEDRGIHFIAFEFVHGVTVRDLIQQRGRLSVTETVQYAIQIASALAHAAARGVVHRDIKPSNLIVTPGGRVKLVDMGLARQFERRGTGSLTQSGVTLGTFDYIAPEQARDPRTADVRSDLYSLGCTLYHMLTGRPPFPEGTVLQKLLQHQQEDPPDVRQLNPSVPRRLAQILRKLMQKDPKDRYQTAEELVADLLEVAADLGLRPVTAEGLIWLRAREGRWATFVRSAVVAALVSVLIIVLGATYGREGLEILGLLPAGDSTRSLSDSSPASLVERKPTSVFASNPRAPATPAEPVTKEPSSGAVRSPQLQAPTRENRLVRTGTELRKAVAEASDGAVLELAPADGTVELTADGRGEQEGIAGIRLRDKRLTLRSAPGQMVRLRLALRPEDPDVAEGVLFWLEDASLTLEGLRLELDAEEPSRPSYLFINERSSVQLRRCVVVSAAVREPNDQRAMGRNWVFLCGGALQLDGRYRPASVSAHQSCFAGGDGFLLSAGPCQVHFVDCVVLPYRRLFVANAYGYANPKNYAVQLTLRRSSVFGLGNPMFQVVAARCLIRAEESVFSAAVDGPTLVELGPEATLSWSGQRNLYHGFGIMLSRRADGTAAAFVEAQDLWAWSKLPFVQERGSEVDQQNPWRLPLGHLSEKPSLQEEQTADLFRLKESSAGYRLAADGKAVGARWVAPWGDLYEEGWGLPFLTSVVRQLDALREATHTPTDTDSVSTRPAPSVLPVGPAATKAEPASSSEVRTVQRDSPVISTRTTTSQATAPEIVVVPGTMGAFSSLAAACQQAPDGATIVIQSNDFLREPTIQVVNKRLTIRAAPGVRPVLMPSRLAADTSAGALSLFQVRDGGLSVQRLELRLEVEGLTLPADASVLQVENAWVELIGCTVSTRLEGPNVDLVRVGLSGARSTTARLGGTSMMPPPVITASVRVRDSLLLSTGAAFGLPPAAKAYLQCENVAAETGGSFLRVAVASEPLPSDAGIAVELRRCTLRSRGPFLHGLFDAQRLWGPPFDVTVERSVFVSRSSSGWIRLPAPGGDASRAVSVLRWSGQRNVYDVNEPLLTAAHPADMTPLVSVNWDNWRAQDLRSEERSVRTTVRFALNKDDAEPVWAKTPAHFILDLAASALPSELLEEGLGAQTSLLVAPRSERSGSERPAPSGTSTP
jgi:serine/threonine protein kinase